MHLFIQTWQILFKVALVIFLWENSHNLKKSCDLNLLGSIFVVLFSSSLLFPQKVMVFHHACLTSLPWLNDFTEINKFCYRYKLVLGYFNVDIFESIVNWNTHIMYAWYKKNNNWFHYCVKILFGEHLTKKTHQSLKTECVDNSICTSSLIHG